MGAPRIVPRRLLATALLIAVSGCGGGGGGGGHHRPTTAVVALDAPMVTSVTLIGTTSEPSVVTGTVATDGGAPQAIADADPLPGAWSLTATAVAGDTEVTVTAEDAVGNQRILASGFSSR
jgi:hypothetical protein